MIHIRLHDLVLDAARRDPWAPALTYRDRTLSYADLVAESAAPAHGLTSLGAPGGERVAIYLDKRVETVLTVLAASMAGLAFVPVNSLLRPPQVRHILDDCTVRVLVTSGDRYEALRTELADRKSLTHVVLVDVRELPEPAGEHEVLSWDELTSGSFGDTAVPPDVPGVDSDLAAIFYTSGSTGSPKGVVLSHRNLMVGAESVSHYLGNREQDRILAALPLSFDAGFSQLTTAFRAGAHVVLMNYVLARDVVRLCARHRITGLTGVPPLWIQLADQDWPIEATRYLRYFANTGGRLPGATLDRLREIFPAARPFLMYGLTEAFRSTYLDPREVDRRPGSIGKAVPNAEVLVVRPDGTPCDPGEEGELVHRGPLVSMGYWNDPERTAERFRPAPHRPGELCTTELAVWSGDRVRADEDGFLYFVGRTDEMIKTSGYRVSPTEIEEAAHDTGLVREAVALGIEDAELGHRIHLVVSGYDGGAVDVEALVAALRRILPRYMLPRQVSVRPSLPRSPNGKFDRATLRRELSASNAASS